MSAHVAATDVMTYDQHKKPTSVRVYVHADRPMCVCVCVRACMRQSNTTAHTRAGANVSACPLRIVRAQGEQQNEVLHSAAGTPATAKQVILIAGARKM